ncbi:MAG TPA: site-specific integrase [Nitrospira sp.]|nr:site-specific integrase [Nitrospira sp.]
MDNAATPPTDPLEPADGDDASCGAAPAAPNAPSASKASSRKKSRASKKAGQTTPKIDLAQFAQQQLEREETCLAKGEGKRSTVDTWHTHLKVLPDWLKAMPLEAITSKDCKTYFDELQKKELASSTITVRKKFLGTLLQRAHQEGKIDYNPCAELLRTEHKPRGGTGPREITEADILSADQLVRVFVVAACVVPPLFFVVMAVILLTGLLNGEARALQLGDLQLDHICGGVRRPRIWVRRIEHGGTLSLAGWEERYVDVPPLLEAILRWWIDTRGITDPAAWLFPGPLPRAGSKRAEQLTERRPDWCVARETVDANWRRIRDRVLPGSRLTLSDLRHTFCALSLLLGEALLYVSLHVGHRSVKYTRRVYNRFIEIARQHTPTPPSTQ